MITIPLKSRYFFESASRRFFDPHVMAYWFTSRLMASQAACLSAAGAGKSGKPCARLMAPCFAARRVISRMTLSLKRAAFFETKLRISLSRDAR